MSSYQEEVNLCMFVFFVCICIAFGDLIIKIGMLDLINRFNSATGMCLSLSRCWISDVICCAQ